MQWLYENTYCIDILTFNSLLKKFTLMASMKNWRIVPELKKQTWGLGLAADYVLMARVVEQPELNYTPDIQGRGREVDWWIDCRTACCALWKKKRLLCLIKFPLFYFRGCTFAALRNREVFVASHQSRIGLFDEKGAASSVFRYSLSQVRVCSTCRRWSIMLELCLKGYHWPYLPGFPESVALVYTADMDFLQTCQEQDIT